MKYLNECALYLYSSMHAISPPSSDSRCSLCFSDRPLSSISPEELLHLIDIRLPPRYAINDAAVDWSAAEEQVKNLANGPKGISSVISLKTTTGPSKNEDGAADAGQKRKSTDGESASGAKKSRRSIKKAKR